MMESGWLLSSARVFLMALGLLLRQVMKEAGFRPLSSEWWHFNRVGRQTAKERYRVIP